MQTIKEKLSDMSAMRKAKAEAKEEEKAEKELAKSRIQVAHEVRMAREAEAEMDHHVNKAAKKVVENERKYTQQGGARRQDLHGGDSSMQDSYVRNPSNPGAGYSNDPAYDGAEGGDPYAYGRETGGIGSAAAAGTGYTGNMSGGPPTNNNLL